ncbi:hypothetical protein ABZ061_03395 [Streptomyces mutabilis]|uniref:hypothetical protein n=1 Tax=Streptomyces mutabilis TaxID=67332 RepID=UPI0033A2A2E0
MGWFRSEQDEHEPLLLSCHVGRWSLLVLPSWTSPAAAAWLMTAASDPHRTATASSLVVAPDRKTDDEPAARRRATAASDADGRRGRRDGGRGRLRPRRRTRDVV